jgi:ATP-dependent Clp protease ATP-binding subunit ClpB
MTSNIGSQWIQELTDREELKEKVTEALKTSFRPEFLNRIDEVVIFNRLGMEEIEKIINIQVEHLKHRLAEKGLTIELTPAAKELLAMEGFDLVYGARPLKRVIQRMVQDALALKILAGEIKEGDHISVDAEAGEIVFKRPKKRAAS